MKKIKTKPREVEVYLDGTDWRYEIGHAADGNRVYPSVDCLKEENKCWDECGIVKCKLVFMETVIPEVDPKDWKNTTPMVECDVDRDRLAAAERHLGYLEEKVMKQLNKVIQLKANIKGKK